MATLTKKAVGQGRVQPTAADVVSTVTVIGSNDQVSVARLSVFNVGASEEVVVLMYRKADGTSRSMGTVTLDEGESALMIGGFGEAPIVLSAGESLQAQTSTPGAVEFVAFGEEGVLT